MSANEPPAGNQPFSGANPPERRDGQPEGAQPAGNPNPAYGAPGQPQSPGAQGSFGPGQPAGGHGQPLGAPGVGPDGQPLTPGVGPDGQPLPPGVGPDGQPLPPGAYGYVPPEQPKKAGLGKRLLSGLVTIVVLVVVGILVRNFLSGPTMKVGDCVQKVGSDEVKVVTCGTPEAEYQILGIEENQSQAASRLPSACDKWPDATTIYWTGTNRSGTTYCMKSL